MIYDCFTFFNELDLLEIRLNILSLVVDRFVLVEGNKTHTGKTKEFIFEENKSRFTQFLDKITYIKVSDFPDPNSFEKDTLGNNWSLENLQRDSIMRGLAHCAMDDIVLVSDLDEIPHPSVIQRYNQENVQGIWILQQAQMYYFINNKCLSNPFWEKIRIGRYRNLLFPEQDLPPKSYYSFSNKGLPTYFRFCAGKVIKNAGWHFSYCGGAEAILQKIQSISEQQFEASKAITLDEICDKISKGQDIYGRKQLHYGPVRLDASFPEYIVRNKEKYKQLILQPSVSASCTSHTKLFYFSLKRKIVKALCIFIPARSWRKKLRQLA